LKIFRSGVWAIALLAYSVLLAGCHGSWDSEWVSARVDNQSGETVRLLEVDYPSASFGADSIAAGSAMQYRFQIRGTGPIKVEYFLGNGHKAQASGPKVAEGQHGTLMIRLLPEGKTEFEASLKPAS
jgi:hypothetical protein